MNSESVGIIGVGLVGGVIADRLAAAGYSVCGFDVVEVANRNFERLASAHEVFARCRIVLLSLPDSGVVRGVLAEAQLDGGGLVIDTTTGKPEDAIANARVVNQAGGDYIEATIAGSSDLLAKGEAPLFLGGDSRAIGAAQGVLEALAARRFHVGDVGLASRFKLMFNLMLGLHRAVLAEALCFGESQGIAPADALEVLRQTPAFSSVMETKGERMVGREFEPPQARLSQHLKDVRLILASGAITPLSETHRRLLESAEELGFGEADTSAVIEAFRKES